MKRLVVLDIDGVLADYRLGLLYWIRQSCPKLAQKANTHLNRTDTWINHESMGISFVQWLDTLEMFRMSGGKQGIPVFEGAQDLINYSMMTLKCDVILLTSRPIDLYSNIYRDTVEWLQNNMLNYHLLLWSKSKAEMVYKMRLHERVLFAVDDEWKHIDEYDNLGIKTFWIDHYDKGKVLDANKIQRVSSLKEILEKLKGEHESYEPTKDHPTLHY